MPNVNRKGKSALITERQARFSRYLDAGVPVGDAIRLALSPDAHDRKKTQRAIPDFAARHGINAKLAAHAIYGGRRPTDEILTALAAELGFTPEFFRNLFSPRATAASA